MVVQVSLVGTLRQFGGRQLMNELVWPKAGVLVKGPDIQSSFRRHEFRIPEVRGSSEPQSRR
jgi:hypothetical protein